MNQAAALDKVRPYIPLLAFVLPTVVVGYGVVIPRSCIAGVNELTIGFGTTILGAAFTYVAGQRAVLPKGVCTKPPFKVRLTRAINRQAARPSGPFGRVLGVIWPKEHGRLNAEVVDALDVQAGQHVLEVGSGTGHALREVARRAQGGRALGLDASELMVKLARERNRHAMGRGEVDVSLGEIEQWPLEVGSFDRIFAVHCIYFWRGPEAVLTKLGRALAPRGKLVLAFRPGGTDVPERFRDPTYRFPAARAVQESLQELGLRTELISSKAEPGVVMLVAENAG